MLHPRVLLFAVSFALASRLATATDPVWPGANWQPATPAQVGMDPAKTAQAANSLYGHACLIRYGYLVATHHSIDMNSNVYSVAKSIAALVFGRLQKDGQVEVSTPVPQSAYPTGPLATYGQFLSMTSDYGLDPHVPGTQYAYNNKAVQHYCEQMQAMYGGLTPPQVLDQALFNVIGRQDPLGFSGLWSGWSGGFNTTARDLARVGYLVLREGNWSGQQIISKSFIQALYESQIPPTATPNWSQGVGPTEGSPQNNWWNQYQLTQILPGNYSYGWWTNANGFYPGLPTGTIWADGLNGNRIIICPEYDLVLTTVFDNNGKSIEQVFKPFIDAVLPNVNEGEVSGDLQQWHDVTITFDGPNTSETDPVNPFLDHRLDVTFTKGGESVAVPGYYAADGDASESGAASGDKWRVHFVPHETGTWNYTASFRVGPDVAVSPNPFDGVPTSFDGASGSFTIARSDKTGSDFRGKGFLTYAGDHYLRFSGTGEVFLKGGANSPENFLAYSGFDGTTPRHHYSPHAGDFTAGDPDWNAGAGQNIIGALNYLASEQMNSVSFLTMNVLGDGDDVWPWIDKLDRYRFDCSKLDQWEIVFGHMDRRGLMMHVFLQEVENQYLLDGGYLGVQRRLYLRELIARFSHHLGLQWNLGEESTSTSAQVTAFADYVRLLDPYDHPIAVHHPAGASESTLTPLLGHEAIDAASLNLSKPSLSDDHTTTWLAASNVAGKPWAVTVDEFGPQTMGVPPDSVDPTHDDARRETLWGSLLSGSSGVEWYFGYAWPHNDFNCEDWRTRDLMWNQTRRALLFFRSYLPFTEMTPANEVVSAEGARCLAKADEVYAIYVNGGTTDVDLGDAPYVFTVQWFDPRNGGPLQDGSVTEVIGPGPRSIGMPPSQPTKDWVALVKRDDQWLEFYGQGLSGYMGLEPKIGANGEPYVGNTNWRAILWDANPNILSVLVIGYLPIDVPVLDGSLYNEGGVGFFPIKTTPAGTANYLFQIANDRSLAGKSLYFQWLVYDLAAPKGASMTRGMKITMH